MWLIMLHMFIFFVVFVILLERIVMLYMCVLIGIILAMLLSIVPGALTIMLMLFIMLAAPHTTLCPTASASAYQAASNGHKKGMGIQTSWLDAR